MDNPHLTALRGPEARTAFVNSILSWLSQNNINATFLAEVSKEAGIVGGIYASQFTKLCKTEHDYCPRPEFFHALALINDWIAGDIPVCEGVSQQHTLRLRSAKPYTDSEGNAPKAHEFWGLFEGLIPLNDEYQAITFTPQEINVATKRLQKTIVDKRKELFLDANTFKAALLDQIELTNKEFEEIAAAAAHLDTLSPDFIQCKLPSVLKAIGQITDESVQTL